MRITGGLGWWARSKPGTMREEHTADQTPGAPLERVVANRDRLHLDNDSVRRGKEQVGEVRAMRRDEQIKRAERTHLLLEGMWWGCGVRVRVRGEGEGEGVGRGW